MPLYIYQCQKCEWLVEKFCHKRDDEVELVCEECEGEEFEKVMGTVYSKMLYGARENLEKRINPAVDDVQKKLSQGSDRDFLDVAGD